MAGRSRKKSGGFSLAEMSVVLIIVGTVIMVVYPALGAMRISAQRNATDSNLQNLMRAIAVYVQANGCLPCPTPAGTTGAGFGRVRGDTAAAACGSCPKVEGIPPSFRLDFRNLLQRTVGADG